MKPMEFPRETAVITFAEDTLWHGIEAELYVDTPLSFFMWVRDVVDKLQEAEDDGKQIDNMNSFFIQFGNTVLRSWNIRQQSVDVEAAGEGLATLSLKFGVALLEAWTRAVSEAPAPLALPSGNGNSSEELPAPTADQSQSRGNSRRPKSSKGSAKPTGASPQS